MRPTCPAPWEFASALTVSLYSLSTILRGVFAGRNIPNQNGYSALVNPASEVVGTSGSAAERLKPFTTSAVSVPSFTCGKRYSDRCKEKVDPSGDDLGH